MAASYSGVGETVATDLEAYLSMHPACYMGAGAIELAGNIALDAGEPGQTDIISEEWRRESNCAGINPELFFPELGAPTREAKAVCLACVKREDCLEYAKQKDIKVGVWGGLSGEERLTLNSAQ